MIANFSRLLTQARYKMINMILRQRYRSIDDTAAMFGVCSNTVRSVAWWDANPTLLRHQVAPKILHSRHVLERTVHRFSRQPGPEETDIYLKSNSKYSDTTWLLFKLDQMSSLWLREKKEISFKRPTRLTFWFSMDSEQRVIMRFLYRQGVAPAEIHTKLKAQYGYDAYSLRSVQR
jgi:hypothetical protein